MFELNKIYQGDALEVLKNFPDESVDCIITSPPYFNLRQYLFDNAVIWAYNVSNEDRERIKKELEKRGITPKQKW